MVIEGAKLEICVTSNLKTGQYKLRCFVHHSYLWNDKIISVCYENHMFENVLALRFAFIISDGSVVTWQKIALYRAWWDVSFTCYNDISILNIYVGFKFPGFSSATDSTGVNNCRLYDIMSTSGFLIMVT